MEIKKIMCCCGSGLGSSMLVHMNVEKVLKKLDKTGIEVAHSSLSDASETSADLFIVGKDLAAFVGHLPHKIVLENMIDINELEVKLKEWF